MQLLSKIKYLKKLNRATGVYFLDNQFETINENINILLNRICLQSFTTLKGRVEAINQIYGFYKNVPIYLNNNLILFNTSNQKDLDNIYINSINIIDIHKDENGTKIIFCDYSQLRINKNYCLIKKYYQRCLHIQNDFIHNQKCEQFL